MISNLIVFGADQISESIATSRYSDKLVVVIHTADLFRDLAEVVFLQDQGYFTFFVVTVSMVFLAALLFIIGWRYYIHVKAYDSVITMCIPVYKNAFETWCQHRKNERSIGRRHMNSTTSNVLNTHHDLSNEELEESTRIDGRPSRFLDFAKVVNNGKFIDRIVDDVKLFQSAIIMFILILPYWLIYAQVK